MNNKFRQCGKCILDTGDDPEMIFDADGICNYCRQYTLQEQEFNRKKQAGEMELARLIQTIKKEGRGKPYDCILGVSGGVDSTYLAYKAKEFGLRPLAVHFDNGWNSELAVNNIERIITRLNLPLHTFIVDWDEFRDLQLSFLKASVVDIELVTDHAIFTQMYKFALKYNIRYILSGTNVATEFILPRHWIHHKWDHINIRSIHRQFGSVPLKTYPLFTSFLKWRISWKGIRSVSLLDYMHYDKEEAKSLITKELGWRDYGGKHYESVFTRFYQGFILPAKFGIDKRKAHLSNLICSGQITREQALGELKHPAYPDEIKNSDYQFVLKKLGLTHHQFDGILKREVKKHSDYPVETDIYQRVPPLRLLRGGWKVIKKIKQAFG